MGLDMYLRVERNIDSGMLPEVTIENPEEGEYVSGYSFQGDEEKRMYAKVVAVAGLAEFASKDTPSACVYPDRVEVTVGYWRKANAIHRWFVQECQGGVDECQPSDPIPMGKIEELISLCQQVIDQSEMHDGEIVTGTTHGPGSAVTVNTVDGQVLSESSAAMAKEILPTTSGFFFGSTEYDQYYISDLKRTVEILTKLRGLPEGCTIRYQSSW